MTDCTHCRAGWHDLCDGGAWTPTGEPAMCRCWTDDHHGYLDPEPDPPDVEDADWQLDRAEDRHIRHLTGEDL